MHASKEGTDATHEIQRKRKKMLDVMLPRQEKGEKKEKGRNGLSHADPHCTGGPPCSATLPKQEQKKKGKERGKGREDSCSPKGSRPRSHAAQ